MPCGDLIDDRMEDHELAGFASADAKSRSQ
jgi:hypothetical protein